jgi:hypothetical protein
LPVVAPLVPLKDQEHAQTNQKNGPDRRKTNALETKFFELKRNSQQGEKAAPETPDHVGAIEEPIHAEVDEDQRPKQK